MKFECVDIHAHLQFRLFDVDREEVIKRTLEGGAGVINIGVDLEDSKKAIALAEAHEGFWATVGLHPTDTPNEDFNYDEFKKLAQHPKVVAIGECGLDYYRVEGIGDREKVVEKQKEVFIKHIELAIEVGKPLMLHLRSAYEDAIEILKMYPAARGNAHFFAGTWEQAKQLFDMGYTISFDGPITFARDYDEIIKNSPLDMLMAETDAPFAAPVPYRGKRNEPLYVREVIKKIAELKGLPYDEVAAATTATAKRVFSL